MASQEESVAMEHWTDRQKPTSSTQDANHDLAGEEATTDELSEIRALLHPGPIQGLSDWGIPPTPDEACDPELEVCYPHTFHHSVVYVIRFPGQIGAIPRPQT